MNDRESLNSHKVVVFILDLDRSTETARAIKSVLASCDSDSDVAVFVHINGSNAEHADRIMQAFSDEPKVKISRSSHNLGYSGGNNHLLSVLVQGNPGFQYILFLNNDAFLEPDTLAKLRSALLVNPDAGAVGPRILQYGGDGTIAADGAGTMPWIMQQYFRNSGKHGKDCPSRLPYDVPFVPGTCMMVRADLLARLGGFDEKFFAYFEDWDLCLRMHAFGHRCLHVADAVVWHMGSLTTGSDSLIYHFLMTRNRYLMARKHLPLHIFVILFLPYFMVSRIAYKVIFLLLMNKLRGIKGILLALAWIMAPASMQPAFWPITNT